MGDTLFKHALSVDAASFVVLSFHRFIFKLNSVQQVYG